MPFYENNYPRGKTSPLSFPQRRIWYLQHLYDDDVMYNTKQCFYVDGPIDMEAFHSALKLLALRHESLRSRFLTTTDGSPCQEIDNNPDIQIDYVDLRKTPESDRLVRSRQIIQEALVKPFVLGIDLMMRVVLVRLTVTEAMLLFVKHHIITDYWSRNRIFPAEISVAYRALTRGETPVLPPLPWHYSDFAEKQVRSFTLDAVLTRRQYWRDFFAGAVCSEPISEAWAQPPSQESPPSYGMTWQCIPADAVGHCRSLAEGHACTLFVVVLSAVALLARFLYGHSRVLLCLASANRQHPGAEQVLGCFFTNIIVSLNIGSGQKLGEVIQDVKTTFAEARKQQDMPFEMFADDLALPCTRQRKPPYRIYISYHPSADDVSFSLPGARLTPVHVSTGRNTHEDIVFNFWEKRSEGGLSLDLEWLCRNDLFDPDGRSKLVTMLESLITHLHENPDRSVGKLHDVLSDDGSLFSLSSR